MQRESSWGCGILSELHKFGSKNLHRCLLQLFHLILNSMTTPEDFATSIIVPLSQFPMHSKRGNDIGSIEHMQA